MGKRLKLKKQRGSYTSITCEQNLRDHLLRTLVNTLADFIDDFRKMFVNKALL